MGSFNFYWVLYITEQKDNIILKKILNILSREVRLESAERSTLATALSMVASFHVELG